MKKNAIMFAALALSAATSLAGPMPPAPAGPPPPPESDPCAGPITYNSVELMYANTDGDFSGDDADGVRLNFEFSPASNFYIRLTGSYDEADNFDVFGVTAGVGGYIGLTENIHLAADGGLVYYDFDYSGVNLLDADDTGWYVRPHVRAKWGCFEIHAGATYLDFDEVEDWAWFAQAYFQITQGWDITAGYNEGGDSDLEVWTIGARWRY